MRSGRSFPSTVGAAALTVAAGISALVVNAGILRAPATGGVGNLTPDQAVVAADPVQPTVRYVPIYVDDFPTASATPQATAADLFGAASAAGEDEEGWYEYEGADQDD